MAQSTTEDVLFFIPDLGGFTKFVAETEIRHSHHIIQELLELLVDANSLDLEVSEFEGDAVLFYRTGAPPSLGELVQQAKTMYVKFHTYLEKFEYDRICQCGACAGAVGLTLKMVAHFGAAGTMQIKDRVKFVGTDIIVAHRLLKNSVAVPEYLLVTRPTLERLPNASDRPDAFDDGADTYDELGEIAYCFRSLADYREEVRVDPPEPVRLRNPRKMSELVQPIDAPIGDVYQTLIDLPGRMGWMDAITQVEMSDDQPNQIGKTHRCVRGEDGIAVMTTEIRITETTMELWETDLKQMSACRYLLTRADGGGTRLVVEFYVRNNPLIRLMFRLLIEKKLTASFARSIANLGRVCEQARRAA